MSLFSTPPGVVVLGECRDRYDEVLNYDALGLLAHLQRHFSSTRSEAIERRAARQHELDASDTLDFLEDTAHIRTYTQIP